MTPSRDDVERATSARVTRRLLPLMFALFMANYLDRVNVSFAALQMNDDLKFNGATYGLGAGLFFLGYCLCQLPSNLVLQRIGARRWIGALAIAWGAVAAGMLFIRGATAFYLLRFLLGAIEAGFFPGMILYVTRWYPETERARAVARFMTAIPVAQIVGGPISGALLGLRGAWGLAGWQWLFLLEGLPSIVLGVLTFSLLTDGPERADWLPAPERAALVARLGPQPAGAPALPLGVLVRAPALWWLSTTWLLFVLVGYGQLLWLPQLIKGASGIGDFTVGLLAVVPPAVAAIVMVRVAASSDRSGERRGYVAGAGIVAAVGFLATAAALRSPLLATAALSIVAIGIAGSFGPFWGLATAALPARTAAAGVALVSAIGNLGGLIGPWVVGHVKDATGSFAGALTAFALLAGLAALLARLTPAGSPAGSATAR